MRPPAHSTKLPPAAAASHLAAIRSQEHAGMAGIARPGRRSVSTTGVGLRGLAERLQ
jgi:hypothetical protein